MNSVAYQTALEEASRSILELYGGARTWSASEPEARSQARHAVRKILAALEKNGVRFQPNAGVEITAVPPRPPPPAPLRRP